MPRRRKGVLREEKPIWRRRAAIAAVVLAVTIVLGFVIMRSLLQAPEIKFSLQAAIVDQLGAEVSNPDFNETGIVAGTLRSAGFNVTYYGSEAVNVAFYEGLARRNFGIIILRSHAALREGEPAVDIFTNEEYKENEHVSEQQDGLLTEAYYSPEFFPDKANKTYFAITPKFIETLQGSFPKSVVIAMGCDTMNQTALSMAQAFIGKGAKMYIGWTGLVGYSQTDNQTVELVRRLLVENETLDDAHRGLYDATYGSMMKYYPPEAGSMRISDLISEAKSSVVAHLAIENSGSQFLWVADERFQMPVMLDWTVRRFSRLDTVAYS
jgi:hypothetical protein